MNAEIELYAQGHSILHRWNAKWKLAALFVLMFTFAQIQHLPWAIAGLLIGYCILLFIHLPLSILWKRLGAVHLIFVPCFLILPFTAKGDLQNLYGIQYSMEGVWIALLFYIRAISVVTLSMVLVYTTPMTRIFHALEQLWVPKVIVQIAVLTYRYLFSLSWEYTNVKNALRSRGFENRMSYHAYHTYANVIGTSLIRSLERTDRVHHAMLCRGYQGSICLMEEQSTRIRDIAFFVLGILLAVMLFFIDRI